MGLRMLWAEGREEDEQERSYSDLVGHDKTLYHLAHTTLVTVKIKLTVALTLVSAVLGPLTIDDMYHDTQLCLGV